MSISENIKKARELRGLSSSGLARLANISPSTLWHYENGKVPPIPKLMLIAKAMLMDTKQLENGEIAPASSVNSGGIISVHFPENMQNIAKALVAFTETLNVPASLENRPDGVRIYIKLGDKK